MHYPSARSDLFVLAAGMWLTAYTVRSGAAENRRFPCVGKVLDIMIGGVYILLAGFSLLLLKRAEGQRDLGPQEKQDRDLTNRAPSGDRGRVALGRPRPPESPSQRVSVDVRTVYGTLVLNAVISTDVRDPMTASTEPATLVPAEGPRSRGQVIVSWLTTTDHKRIGHLYLVTSFVFFLIGGRAGAWSIRAELARPGLQFLSRRAVQPAVHHARHDHAAAVRHADLRRPGQLRSCRCRSAHPTWPSRG